MLTKAYTQVKRELWEHKAIIVNSPAIFFTFCIALFILGMGFFIISDSLHFKMNGEIAIQANNVETRIIFDGQATQTIAKAFETVEHTFEKELLGMRVNNPELAIDSDSKTHIRRSEHLYEEVLENRLSITLNSIELIVMFTLASLFFQMLLNDRKDKSVLFWRSLPISESYVFIAKIVTVFVITPLVYFFFLYLALGISLAIFAVVEFFMSSISGLTLSSIFWTTYINAIVMFKSFAFQIIWFLPLFLIVGIAITLFRVVGGSVFFTVLFFMLVLLLSLDNLILVNPYISQFVQHYFSYGVEATLHAKFNVLWQDAYPRINIQWLIYALLTSIVLTITIIQCRKKEQF